MKDNEMEGIVLELRGELALVRPTGHTSCNSSYCCQGEGVKKIDLEARNMINAVVGDKVIFEAKEAGLLLAAFITFILPFILVFIGGVLGNYISGLMKINITATVISGGIIFLIISILIIKFHDKSVSKNINLKPVIVRKA
jgi:sigma-E factor negative regulatory protein RseC